MYNNPTVTQKLHVRISITLYDHNPSKVMLYSIGIHAKLIFKEEKLSIFQLAYRKIPNISPPCITPLVANTNYPPCISPPKDRSSTIRSFVKCGITNKLDESEDHEVNIKGIDSYIMPQPEEEFRLVTSSEEEDDNDDGYVEDKSEEGDAGSDDDSDEDSDD